MNVGGMLAFMLCVIFERKSVLVRTIAHERSMLSTVSISRLPVFVVNLSVRLCVCVFAKGKERRRRRRRQR